MSLAAASKHIKVLERAGLVRRTVDGRRHVCRLDAGPLASACCLAPVLRALLERAASTPSRRSSAPTARPERRTRMTMTNPAAVRLHRTIPAPPERVYRAWLDPELLRRWLAPGGLDGDAVRRSTSASAAASGSGRGRRRRGPRRLRVRVLELVPDGRIVFRWRFVGPDRTADPAHDSRLTITFGTRRAAPRRSRSSTSASTRSTPRCPAWPRARRPGWGMALDKLAATIGGGGVMAPRIGTREEWLAARTGAARGREGAHPPQRRAGPQRQQLPWVRIDKDYRFETTEGTASLRDLFRGRSQLLVQHIMFPAARAARPPPTATTASPSTSRTTTSPSHACRATRSTS